MSETKTTSELVRDQRQRQEYEQALEAVRETRPPTLAELRDRVALIRQAQREVMKDGVHYGTTPGTQNPSLKKPGAELLLSMFGIRADHTVESLGTDGEVHYRVTTTLHSIASGRELGSSSGECSSMESKYKWKACYVDKEYEETDPTRRRIQYKQSRDGRTTWENKQIRQEPADVANTILKMAIKRSTTGVVLQVLAASEVFSQDMEEDERDTGTAPPPPADSHDEPRDAPAEQAFTEGQVEAQIAAANTIDELNAVMKNVQRAPQKARRGLLAKCNVRAQELRQ